MHLDLLYHANPVEVVVTFETVPRTILLPCIRDRRWRKKCALALSVVEFGAVAEASPESAWLLNNKPFVLAPNALVPTLVHPREAHRCL